jgi:hypothetical protein
VQIVFLVGGPKDSPAKNDKVELAAMQLQVCRSSRGSHVACY